MSEYASVERIKSLKQGIEAKTGGSYADLTAGVQALVEGYGVGSAPVLNDLDITVNGEYTPPDGVDGFGKVTANVVGSGGAKTATGTIVLDADADYVKVTGLDFTPIAFVVVPTTIIATSTVGAVFVRGTGALWRTGTGNTSAGPMAHKLELDGYTVYPDDSEFKINSGQNYYDVVRVFDSGFGFHEYNNNFPIRAGTVLEWWAMG